MSFLLSEDGFHLLQENGDKFILDNQTFDAPASTIAVTQQADTIKIIQLQDIDIIVVD